jgi:hypothetical protein
MHVQEHNALRPYDRLYDWYRSGSASHYYQCLKDTDGKMEFANVGAGIGEGFENTVELKPMKYNEVINGPDRKA